MDMDVPSSPSPTEQPSDTRPRGATARDDEDAFVRRVGAALIDLVCLTAVAITMAAVWGSTAVADGSASFVLTGPAFVAFAVVVLGYYVVLEATLGRTIGKALLSLRVVDREDGQPTVLAVAGRTVLRVIAPIAPTSTRRTTARRRTTTTRP
jgi:uncharacterized RDD family membrane protein YckC